MPTIGVLTLYFLEEGEPLSKLESKFQAQLIKKLELLFPGSIILINDPRQRQGIPDLVILWNTHWAALECKREPDSSRRPNQEYYVDHMNQMSYAAFIYPENEEIILDALQRSFGLSREACLPVSVQ